MNNILTQAAVTILRNAEADGETMESIITELGLREQVVQRMQLMDVQLLARLVNPTAVANAETKPAIHITREQWEEMIADIQQAVESRMDSIDASELIGNVEASIYNGCFTIDSVAIDSSAIADELTDTIDSALRDAIGNVAHLDFVENLA